MVTANFHCKGDVKLEATNWQRPYTGHKYATLRIVDEEDNAIAIFFPDMDSFEAFKEKLACAFDAPTKRVVEP